MWPKTNLCELQTVNFPEFDLRPIAMKTFKLNK